MHTFAAKSKATQQSVSAKSSIPGRVPCGQSPEVRSILHLQRTIENQAVQRMLQTHTEEPRAGLTNMASPRFGHDFSRIPIHASVSTQEADSITYSTPSKRGAPLTNKGPWVGMAGNGGPGTKSEDHSDDTDWQWGGRWLEAGVPADGSASAATPPKLSKKTVAGPLGRDCGGFTWSVQWELDKKTTKGGWVVQKVELLYDVKDCNDEPVDPEKVGGLQPSWFPLWEAWRIDKDQQVTPEIAEEGRFQDDNYFAQGLGRGTRGPLTVKGTVEFYDGLTLPSSFKTVNEQPSVDMPTTKSDPMLSGGTGAIPHELKADWDCCSTAGAAKPTKIETL
jgi:hypothetical protein